MNINVLVEVDGYIPLKAHDGDAGFDLRTPFSTVVRKGSSVVIDTLVHIQIPYGYVGMIKSKSGLNVNHNLTAEGVIDYGYTGSIKVKLYNHGNNDYEFNQGDKITQIVILPIAQCNELTLVADFEETERGNNGFGSTGK